jgi:molybdopterin-containing oxidoreductase family iron-sulfur binding subunit
VLSLYDSARHTTPLRDGSASTWVELDRALGSTFEGLRSGRVRLLTGSVHGASTRAAIARFLDRFEDGRHVSYDGLSASALVEAHERAFGERVFPRHHFDRARTIAAFDADFLSTWVSPVEFTAAYTRGRALDAEDPRMSRHFHLEPRLSLTGSRADERARLAPWETAPALAGLCDLLEERARPSNRRCAGSAARAPERELLEGIAAELWETRGESLVVAGANDVEIQLLAAYANHLVGSHGTTLDLDRSSQQRLGDDRALAELADELRAGSVDALIVQGVNPAYDLAGRLPVERAKLLVACGSAPDETSALAGWVAPEPHFLETWDDAEPYRGTHVLRQPTVPVLFGGRTLRESLARWSGDDTSDRELLRATWREEVFARTDALDFDAFFDDALHEGFVELEEGGGRRWTFDVDAVRPPAETAAPAGDALALVLYPKAGMLDGRNGHNPWLHELPDPISKITWDNYACLSPATAAAHGLGEGDRVRVEAEGLEALDLPVHVQRGQHDGVVAVALGYGRAGTDRFTDVGPLWLEGERTVAAGGVIGTSAAALVDAQGGARRFAGRSVSLTPTGASVELAASQDHHSLTLPEDLAIEGHEDRQMVFSSNFEEWSADPGGMVHRHPRPSGDLWEEDHETERTWGLAIDLARCTGCSACVVGCQSENNVPVVGRDEVGRHREMSWLRIDRYYQGEEDDLLTLHQPMMCQQCDHAPCEAVCPVLATVHSDEGLNQQVYNRCVGTRYCANTCPYKVRRFNWFEYRREDELENQALNPDVTVRSRGVMEKCSFCVQRIQEAKGEARREGRELRDGDIVPACQQSCPAEAIVFGDLKDPESRVARLAAKPRAYAVLEELNVQPSVRYLAHVHNGPARQGRAHHGGGDAH